MQKQILLLFFIFILTMNLKAQQRVGINTTTPAKILHVNGISNQYIRIQSSSIAIGAAGMEFVRGTNDLISKDWLFVNDGPFRIFNSDDNFGTSSEVMRINTQYNTGIGTVSPSAKLHIDGGSLLSFGGYGYLKIGSNSSLNLAFDNTQLLAFNNGNPAPLYIQTTGGNTHFGLNGGNTLMAIGGGGLGVGTMAIDAGLNISNNNFQLYIDNDADDANGWYIGASNNTWQAGDDQLLFSPGGSSDDAVLRLMDVTDNDGTNAPVMIHSTNDQTLLLDGNEIDTRGTPLYINHNTDQETYINPSGGMVGIGTSNPQAMVHVNTSSGHVLTLQRGSAKWHLDPLPGGNQNLGFYWDNLNSPYGQIDGMTGQWFHISDRHVKENITPLPDVMDQLKKLDIYSYSFKHDTAHRKMIGVIAQEAEPIFPEAVKYADDQYGVSYGQLAAVGLKAIKEQQAIIDQLKERVRLLKISPLSESEHSSSPSGN